MFVATSRTFETASCSILPFNTGSALLSLRFLPDCEFTGFLLSEAITALLDLGAVLFKLLLPALSKIAGGSDFFASLLGLLAVGFPSFAMLAVALFSSEAGLTKVFDAALAITGLLGVLIDLDCVFGAGFSAGGFAELLDAFLAAVFAGTDVAFFALAVKAGFFAATLFMAEVTTVFISSLPDVSNALL